MTAYTHHVSDTYLHAYMSELTSELTTAYRQEPVHKTLRTGVARTLVRVGAWMLPNEPEFVSDTIVVLPILDLAKRQDGGATKRVA